MLNNAYILNTVFSTHALLLLFCIHLHSLLNIFVVMMGGT